MCVSISFGAKDRTEGAKLYLPHMNPLIGGADKTVDCKLPLFWYAAYTSSRHEKKVAEHLRQRDVECFLPLYETVHRWANGRHKVQLPLFPGYVFVHINLENKVRVLQVPGLVEFVTFQDGPAILPDADIEALQTSLTAGLCTQPHPYLAVGSRVEICRGPLQGMRGVLLRQPGVFRVVLSIEMIMRAIVVEVEASDVIALDPHVELAMEAGSRSRNGIETAYA